MTLNFGPDKSMIIRGFAIIFMIILHNDVYPEFKICVPIFTVLVGYGYNFAKRKNIIHGIKRIWHLLSHFWLILLGICLPVSILIGNYEASLYSVFLEMFGLESYLNWFSWYIYFYIFAMFVMIPVSRFIDKYGILGTLITIIVAFGGVASIHLIPNWTDNVGLQAIQDCFLVSPTMFVGYYLAKRNIPSKIIFTPNIATVIILLLLASGIFFFRGIPYMIFLDFITVPAFILALVAIFNIIKTNWVHNIFIKLGKESMNMWFLHALFFTSFTASLFMPLLSWLQPKILLILGMIIVTYLASKLINSIYKSLVLPSSDLMPSKKT